MSLPDIAAAVRERMAAAKPDGIGAIAGVLATLMVEFGAGWVVSADAHAKEVTAARVNAMATVCAHNAREYWTEQGREIKALEGWRNDKRDRLAERFVPEVTELERRLPALEQAERPAMIKRCDEVMTEALWIRLHVAA